MTSVIDLLAPIVIDDFDVKVSRTLCWNIILGNIISFHLEEIARS
jgi:hypothetical protein